MKKSFKIATMGLIMAFISCTSAVSANEYAPTVIQLLKDSGAVEMAANDSYGSGLEAMYIGFDGAGKPTAAVAVRETKTYKKITTIVSVVPTQDGYKIQSATSPNIAKLPGESKNLVQEALTKIEGTALTDAANARSLVDSVTGATKYYKAVYISYSLMVGKAIEELGNNPDWPRQPVE